MSSVDVWAFIQEQLLILDENMNLAQHAGGNLSSIMVQNCMELIEMLQETTVPSADESEATKKRLDQFLALWRAALAKHNEQTDADITYDVITGNPRPSK